MSNVEDIFDYHSACLRTAPDGMTANNLMSNALLKSEGELEELFDEEAEDAVYPDKEEFGDCCWYVSLGWLALNILQEKYIDSRTSRNRDYSAKEYCHDLSKVLYDEGSKSLKNPSDWTKEETKFEISKHLDRCCENFGKFLYHCDGKNGEERKKKYLKKVIENFHDYECHLFLEAFRHDWDMVEIWRQNIEKLEERYPDGFDPNRKT